MKVQWQALGLMTAILAGCQTLPASRPHIPPFGLFLDRFVEPERTQLPMRPDRAAPEVSITGADAVLVSSGVPSPHVRPGRGGGSSMPVGEAGASLTGTVRDEAEVPVGGATLRLVSGATVTSDADGRFQLRGALVGAPIVVSHPAYATSVVTGLSALGDLHLRRIDGRTEVFNQRRVTLSGMTSWPDADHQGGVAYYQDSLDSFCQPVPLAADGSFSLEIRTRRPGEPTGVVLVYAGDSLNRTLMGVSPVFEPFSQEAPGPIAMRRVTQTIPFNGGALPNGLTQGKARLELVLPDHPPITLESMDGVSGSFPALAGEELPGPLRVVIEAQDAVGSVHSRLAMGLTAGSALGSFLAPPSLAFDRESRVVTWSDVPGVAGYRVEARPEDALAPLWEAWVPEGTRLTLPSEPWLQPGRAEVRVEAIEAEGFGTYAIAAAGPRPLRITPWVATLQHRTASRRILLGR